MHVLNNSLEYNRKKASIEERVVLQISAYVQNSRLNERSWSINVMTKKDKFQFDPEFSDYTCVLYVYS